MKWNILVASMVLGLGLSTQSFGFDLLDRMLGGSGCAQKGSAGCCDKGASQKACHNGCAQKDGAKDPCQKTGCARGLLGGCVQRACCDPKGGKDDGCGTKNGNGCTQKAGLGLGLLNGCAQRACCDPKGGKDDGCGAKNGNGCTQKAGLGLGLLNGCAQRACCDPKGGKDNGGGTKNGNGCTQKAGLGLGLFGGHTQKACCDPKGGKDDGCGTKSGKDDCSPKCTRGPSLLERIFACNRRVCCDPKGGKGTKGGWDDKGDMKAVPAPADEAPMPPAPVVDASAFLNGSTSVVQASARLVH